MSINLFEESDGIELQTELPTPITTPGEVVLGVLTAIDESGCPVISFPQFPHFEPVAALATIPVLPKYIGRQVALMFTQGTTSRAVVMGFVYSPLQQVLDNVIEQTAVAISGLELEDQKVFDEPAENSVPIAIADPHSNTLHVDGKRVVIEGQEEVVLKCGESSITLTQNGKVVIRGKYLLSRSSGVNRILGGSVQVN